MFKKIPKFESYNRLQSDFEKLRQQYERLVEKIFSDRMLTDDVFNCEEDYKKQILDLQNRLNGCRETLDQLTEESDLQINRAYSEVTSSETKRSELEQKIVDLEKKLEYMVINCFK